MPTNADMTAHGAHYLLCLDGVSGVPPPLKAEDFSWDLRNVMQWNLRRRFSVDTDRAAYDTKLKEAFNPDEPKSKGEWLRNLLAMSLTQVTMFGSTTLAAVGLFGERLTWLKVGDCTLLLLRYDHDLGTYITKLNPAHQMVQGCFDQHGRPCVGPAQLTCYQTCDMTVTNAMAQASKASYKTEEVRAGDIVILMSDGPGDCLRLSEIYELVTVAYGRGENPSELAERIVNAAISSGNKVDDMSCVVGFVKEKDLKRKWKE